MERGGPTDLQVFIPPSRPRCRTRPTTRRERWNACPHWQTRWRKSRPAWPAERNVLVQAHPVAAPRYLV